MKRFLLPIIAALLCNLNFYCYSQSTQQRVIPTTSALVRQVLTNETPQGLQLAIFGTNQVTPSGSNIVNGQTSPVLLPNLNAAGTFSGSSSGTFNGNSAGSFTGTSTGTFNGTVTGTLAGTGIGLTQISGTNLVGQITVTGSPDSVGRMQFFNPQGYVLGNSVGSSAAMVIWSNTPTVSRQLPTQTQWYNYGNGDPAQQQNVTAFDYNGSGATLDGLPIGEHTLDAGMPVPFLGWNSILDTNSYGGFPAQIPSGAAITNIVTTWSTNGMLAAGYNVIWLDDGWQSNQWLHTGNDYFLQANPTYFPQPLSTYCAYAHANGFKIGIYTSQGDVTCLGLPGTPFELIHTHLKQLAFAGFDYLKIDQCTWQNTPGDDYPWKRAFAWWDSQIAWDFGNTNVMGLLFTTPMQNSGEIDSRDTVNFMNVFENSAGGGYPANNGISDMPSVMTISAARTRNNWAQRVGHWNEIASGGEGLPGRNYSTNTWQAYMTMNAILSSTLYTGGTTYSMPYLTNLDVLAVRTNGYAPGVMTYSNNLVELWLKPIFDSGGHPASAVAVVNMGSSPTSIGVSFDPSAGQVVPSQFTNRLVNVHACWAHTNLNGFVSAFNPYLITVGATNCELLVITNANPANDYGSSGPGVYVAGIGGTFGYLTIGDPFPRPPFNSNPQLYVFSGGLFTEAANSFQWNNQANSTAFMTLNSTGLQNSGATAGILENGTVTASNLTASGSLTTVNVSTNMAISGNLSVTGNITENSPGGWVYTSLPDGTILRTNVLTGAYKYIATNGNETNGSSLFLGGSSKISLQAGSSHQGDDYNVYTVPGNVLFNSPNYQWFDNQNNREMQLVPGGLNLYNVLTLWSGNLSIAASSNYYMGSSAFLTNNNPWPELAGRAAIVPPLQYNVLNDIGVPAGSAPAGSLGIAFSNGIVNLSTNGMYASGWRWAIMDDGWEQTNRDGANNLQVDSNFILGGSNGLASLFSFSHGLGFSNILYTSYADIPTAVTCSGRAGTPIQYAMNDAVLMLHFGIDGYKVDQCVWADGIDFTRQWRYILDTLPNSGFCSNYLYLICTDIENPNGGGTFGDDVQMMLLANQAEYGQDYGPLTMATLVRAGKHRLPWKDLVRPGHYFEVGSIGCFPGFVSVFDTNQVKNAITMNTIMAAPIVSSSCASNAAYAALCNDTNWISVHQNPAVVCGFPISSNNSAEIWMRPMGGGNLFGRWNVGQSNAVACFNYSGSSKAFSVYWTNLGLPNSTVMTVIDDWSGTTLGNFSGGFTVTEPTGTNALLYTLMPVQAIPVFDFSKNITSAQLICDYNFSAANLPTGSNIFNLVDQGKTGLILCTNFVSTTNAPYQTNNAALYNGAKFAYFTGQAGTGVGNNPVNTTGMMQLSQPTAIFWVGTAPQNSGGTAYDGNTAGGARQAVFFQSATTTTMYAGSSLTATLNNTTRYIHCNVFAAGSSIYYTNGQVAATGNAGTQFLGSLAFGCASGGGSNGNEEMARLLIYSGIPNTNDFVSINNALNALYHVAPNLGQ